MNSNCNFTLWFSSAGGPGMIIDHVDGDEDRADGKPLVDPDVPGKLNYKGFPSFVEIKRCHYGLSTTVFFSGSSAPLLAAIICGIL